MLGEVERQRSAVAALCRQYRVRRLRLFGSAATGTFVPATSDLDFVAEFAGTHSADYPDRYLDFAEALERLFNRRVDLLTERAIRNPYFRTEVERTAQVIYEAHLEETPA
jgi:predicted nucleotidyltransferase